MARKLTIRCVPRYKSEWTTSEVLVSERDVAEDVVIRLSKDLNISPTSRHIFALFHPHCKLWLSPNQNISRWLNEEQVHILEFRIRFQPSDLTSLAKDQAAFDYYFFQVRHDFRKKQKNSPSGNKIQLIMGLVVADIIVYVIESNPHLDKEEAEQKLREISMNDFVPLPPLHRLMVQAHNKCRSEMLTAWSNSCQDANIPKLEYIRTLVGAVPDAGREESPLWPEYHVEQYSADLIRDQRTLMLLDFQPLKHEIRVKHKFNTSCDWSYLCCVEELCFIAVKVSSKTIEVSRLNGTPIYLCFEMEKELKSFVSLLDGYYRLSQKWSFSICKEIASPSLMMLKSLKCHGPVGAEFAHRKLAEKADDKHGAYILRQSEKRYYEYVLDVCLGKGERRSFKISESNDGFACESLDRSFPSLTDLLSNFILTNSECLDVKLTSCIPPSENDKSDRLLMCHLKSKSPDVSKRLPLAPIVFKSTSITDHQILSNGIRYIVTAGLLGEESVVVKQVRQESEIVSFLQSVNDWVHLRSDCLVAMRGVIMSPPSLVMENYCQGPLDTFLIQHQRNLKPVDLIEAATYCAQALWYLEEQNLIHGSIRCHNLLVSAFTPQTLKVKLSDPLSNCSRVSPWLAPEETDGQATAAGDLWSYGTTLWEIFSFGKNPSSHNVRDLVQPFGCPSEVWDLIHGCWENRPEERKQPQAIVRDIGQIMCEVYNSRRTNTYSTIDYSNASKPKGFFARSFGGSALSLRSSIRSTDTLLTGLTSESDLISLRSDDPYEFTARPNNESWLIEANQLSLEHAKVLGQGCYGEVVKAVLTKWCGLETEVVAVKRINPNVPIDSGLRDMRREIEIMKKLNHRHIVEIKGFVEDPQLMLVMEYMELGSLVSYLRVHKHRMLQDAAATRLPLKKFALDIVDGMTYLESKKIVHRDLAARNVLVASETEVKISDFGLAQVIKEGDYYRMRTQQCLPLRWYAPESIMRGTFTHKSDVWSAGVVLWEMYSYGRDVVYPQVEHDYELLQKLEEGKRLECPAENCPLEVYEIMLNCWKTCPDQRPSFHDLQTQIIALND